MCALLVYILFPRHAEGHHDVAPIVQQLLALHRQILDPRDRAFHDFYCFPVLLDLLLCERCHVNASESRAYYTKSHSRTSG